MHSLIAERPNLVPVGLGNNLTPVGLSLLLPSNKPSDDPAVSGDDGEADEGGAGQTVDDLRDLEPSEAVLDWDVEFTALGATTTSNTEESDGIGVGPDSDKEDNTLVAVPAKRKVKTEAKTNLNNEKKTPARPGISAPAVRPEKKKAKSAVERFSDIAQMEESAQKELDLKAMKVKGVSSVKIAKIEAQTRLQIEKEKTKAVLAAKKMDQAFQLQMLELQQWSAQFQHFSSQPLAGPSNYRYPTHLVPAPPTNYPSYAQQDFDFSHPSASTDGSSSTHGESYRGMEEFMR